MTRRPIVIVAALVLVAGVAVNGAWYYARHLALDAVDRWVAEQRDSGTAIEWAERRVTGWPLRLDGLFTAPRAAMATPGRTLRWQGPDTGVRFYLFAPDTIDFGAPGQHRLFIEEDGAIADFTLDAATLDARADTSLTGLAATDITAGGTGLALRGPGDAPVATAKALQLYWQQPATVPAPPIADAPLPVTLQAALRVDGLTLAPGMLPPVPAPILGNEIAVLRINLAVNGALDPRRPPADALAEWRDNGGTIDVGKLEIAWGPVRLAGDGTLALDAALQPEGAFAARVSGLTEMLTALENAAMIDARTAAIARITLAVLTRPAENGGPPEARVPLTIQAGTLSVGPVALLKLPKVTWR